MHAHTHAHHTHVWTHAHMHSTHTHAHTHTHPDLCHFLNKWRDPGPWESAHKDKDKYVCYYSISNFNTN